MKTLMQEAIFTPNTHQFFIEGICFLFLSVPPVGPDYLAQRNMRVTVARLGIFLWYGQSNGFFGAGMDTGQAGLTAARDMYGPPILHMDGTGRTDLLTDPAACASATYLNQMLPGVCWHLPGRLEELPMYRPV